MKSLSFLLLVTLISCNNNATLISSLEPKKASAIEGDKPSNQSNPTQSATEAGNEFEDKTETEADLKAMMDDLSLSSVDIENKIDLKLEEIKKDNSLTGDILDEKLHSIANLAVEKDIIVEIEKINKENGSLVKDLDIALAENNEIIFEFITICDDEDGKEIDLRSHPINTDMDLDATQRKELLMDILNAKFDLN